MFYPITNVLLFEHFQRFYLFVCIFVFVKYGFIGKLQRSLPSLFEEQGLSKASGYEQSVMDLTTGVLQVKHTDAVKMLKLSKGMATYLSNTRIRDVLWCFGFNETGKLDNLFQVISIYDKGLYVVKVKTAIFKSFPRIKVPFLQNLHELCPFLPWLYSKLYSDDNFLSRIAGRKGMTYSEFYVVMLKMNITTLYKQYEIRSAMYDTFTKKEIANKLKLKGDLVLEAVQITTASQQALNPFDIAAQVHGTTSNSLKTIYQDKVFGLTAATLFYFNSPISSIEKDLPHSVRSTMRLNELSNIITKKLKSVQGHAKLPLNLLSIRRWNNKLGKSQ